MGTTKATLESYRAALRTEEKKLQEILAAIELNDISLETVVIQVRELEDSFRRLRNAA